MKSNHAKPIISPEISSASTARNLFFKPVQLLKYTVGRTLSSCLKYYNDNQELKEVARIIECRSLEDRLSDEKLAQLMAHQDSTFDLELRKKTFREADHTRTFHGIIMPHLERLFKDDPSIKSLLNIGCNYAYMDSLLAKKYSNIDFMGVDVNQDLVNLNSDLAAPNHKFYSGYALDLLENGTLQPEACYMSSTATVIRNKELKRYLRALNKTAKYVAFSEPIWILPGNEVTNPESVDVDHSKPGYIQRQPITSEYGYLCYIHNYKKLLDQAGFEPIMYKFYRPKFTYLYWVVAIGQNRNNNLWNS